MPNRRHSDSSGPSGRFVTMWDRAEAVGAYRELKEVKALSPSLQIQLAKAGEGGAGDGSVVVLMSIPAQSAATSHEEQAAAAAGMVAYERRRGGTVFITFLHVKKEQRRKGEGLGGGNGETGRGEEGKLGYIAVCIQIDLPALFFDVHSIEVTYATTHANTHTHTQSHRETPPDVHSLKVADAPIANADLPHEPTVHKRL